MIRLFDTHRIRKQIELTDQLWNFNTPGEEARKVMVPGCWEKIPGFENYHGTAEYSRPIRACGNYRFVFDGVSHTGIVSIDGEKLAEHYGAFTPFSFTTRLSDGDHQLSVAVDNSFSERSALHVPNDYYTYGGITRPVYMEEISDCGFISSISCIPEKTDEGWRAAITVSVNLLNASEYEKSGIVLSCVFDPDHSAQTIDMTRTTSDDSTVTYTGIFESADVKTWSPEDPNLYLLQAILIKDGNPVDDLIERVGFRAVELDGYKILLNGKPIRIKGFCRHEDHEMFGCALPLSTMQKDIELIRDMSGNSIRTTHYPNDQRFLDLCDEEGILIWEESHARGLEEEAMRNPNFEPQSELCISEMIPAHINHPCIYIWGCLNECASETEYGRTCYEKQVALFRKLDPSRPVTFATCKFDGCDGTYKGEGVHINDICLDLPDVVSFNMYPLWYFDTDLVKFTEEFYRSVQGTPGAGKPMIISEIGAGAEYGYRDPAHARWSEEYQADVLPKQIDAILGNPDYTGIYLWQFADVRVSESWFARRPRSHNNKGIVDEFRRPKLAYEKVRESFNKFGNYRD